MKTLRILQHAVCIVAQFGLCDVLLAQGQVSPVFVTGEIPNANVDSCAVWVAPQGSDTPSLLFVTEKELDRIEVWNASIGQAYAPRPFLGGPQNSSEPGEFDRPNGVWVIYHVPTASGFADVLIVTDQTNQRVQVIRLPSLDYYGEFGVGEIGKGYGIAWYQDGTDFFVYITDEEPPAKFPGKIKKYRLRPDGERLGADLVDSFGSETGTPELPRVESILADRFHDRLHVCGDEGGDFILVFGLDGAWTGTTYGDPQFENDQEGINLYETGPGSGYLVISDQYRTSATQFEVFERATLAPIGNFGSAEGGPVTENTDGAYLEQRPLAGFPNGGFYAINDDENLHAYDWTDIAAELDLEIVALDRPFAGRASDDAGERATARSLLWFYDASWWGVLAAPDGLKILRLEDGTFRAQTSSGSVPPGDGIAVSVCSLGDDLFVAARASDGGVTFTRFRYDASLRRYDPRGEPAVLPAVTGSLVDMIVESNVEGPSTAWVAWIANGELRVTWSAPPFEKWHATGVSLGSARFVAPRLARFAGATAVIWAENSRVMLRLHNDGAVADTWHAAEEVMGAPADEIAVAASDASLLVAGVLSESALWLRRRSGPGAFEGGTVLSEARVPALMVDSLRDRVHILYAAGSSGRRLFHHRQATLDDLVFGDAALVLGWPGVDMGELASPRELPAEAQDLIALAMGSDDLGYFGRVSLPGDDDRNAPITLQHVPAPGTENVGESATVSFRIVDDRAGVDRASLKLLINGSPVAATVRGVPRNFLVSYQLPGGSGPRVRVRIEAVDRATKPRSHVMTPFEYEFFTGPKIVGGFRRGDANEDGSLDVSDAIRILLVLFAGRPAARCLDAEDANDDGRRDLSDAIFTLNYLFGGGEPISAPFPNCGEDPTEDALICEDAESCL